MAKVVENQIVKISKQALKRGVVILDLKEYKELIERAVPTYYLKGKAAKNLDKLVREGLKEHREGKTELLEDFLRREYPKLYEKYSKD